MSLITYLNGVLARRKAHGPSADEARKDFKALVDREISAALSTRGHWL